MNKLFNKYAFLSSGILAVLLFGTNILVRANTEILIVTDQKTSCRGIAAMDCLQIKRDLSARVKSGKNSSSNQPGLFKTEWKLTRIEGKAIKNDRAFIRFDERKKSAGGNGGCNAFGGNFAKKGSRIKISQIISTKMFCENGSDVENNFFTNLDRVNNYEIKNGKLFLKTNRRVVLEFEAKK